MGDGNGGTSPEDIDYDADYRSGVHDFYDLMKKRISKILLVSSLYDAFTLEEDGLIFEQISEEYKELALPFPPQVIRVSSGVEALNELGSNRFDMVITMARISDMDPDEFCRKAKEIRPGMPVILLLNDAGDLKHYRIGISPLMYDHIFFWNGDATLLMAMTKLIEDSQNLDADIRTGRVKIILLVENDPRFYSFFLPLIYTEIMTQTLSLLSEVINEHEKMLRKRARPKILLARNCEEAEEVLGRYADYMLGVISDISFPRKGQDEPEAGFSLAYEVGRDMPILLQSSKPEHRVKAEAMGLPFLDKGSETIIQDIKDFFNDHLGFGAFNFRMPDGTKVGQAYSMTELTRLLKEVPAESINLAGRANKFSRWLIARQEIGLAMKLKPKKVSDFSNDEEIRNYLLREIKESQRIKQLGMIIDFNKQHFEFEGSFTRLGAGSLGGKGRGIAFLSSLLHQSGIGKGFKGCPIYVPDTLVIGTDTFDHFVHDNGIQQRLKEGSTDEEIKDIFLSFDLPVDIITSLRDYLDHVRVPIAVRSSSLLEDSQNQPFAGIYSTYILPNSSDSDEERLLQLCQAIKLVYASTFFKAARAYIQTTVHLPEEEKMAIVLQKLVGRRHGTRFYPEFSGVAQSHNFYPMGPLKREEGIVSIALGLGRIVVEGGRVMNFSPEHPNVIPGFSTAEEALKNSQDHFFSLDLGRGQGYDLRNGEDVTLESLPIAEAENDGTLDFLASTYVPDDNRLRDGVGHQGPRVISFAGILKYEKVPLVDIIRTILDMGQKGMGRPVEIEFAGTIDDNGRARFSIVQIRPLVTLKEKSQVLIAEGEKDDALIYTDRALGNGILERIFDVVFVEPGNFDKTMTVETASLIEQANASLEGRPYILIGPGRWGTMDRFLGIPVQWDQISGARVMVETSMPDFMIDPSHGTHFFHNITSLGVPYFTVSHRNRKHRIDWDSLRNATEVDLKGVVKLARYREPLMVKVDGRSGEGIILPSRNP
ncbi:MAG: histidine kinase [Candidatus Thermoplasmatota archaeon]|nr:histidine kinase [Candidatus Thermoplasmatota archaeon]